MSDRDNVTEIRPVSSAQPESKCARIAPDDPARDVLAAAYDNLTTTECLLATVASVLWGGDVDDKLAQSLAMTLNVASKHLREGYEPIDLLGAASPRKLPDRQD